MKVIEVQTPAKEILKWKKVENLKLKDIPIKLQEELTDHAFDWGLDYYTDFSKNSKVKDIFFKIELNMKEFFKFKIGI